MSRLNRLRMGWLLLMGAPAMVLAEVGDPQLRTDHPWYPGELALSSFERLFETQARLYERVVGRRPVSDQDKALAAWHWRNTHYWHGEEGAENLWGRGFTGGDLRTREYWTGLFAHGFGLCGTTHSQWTAEIEHLLGHGRGRGVGVDGHNAFEVFLHGPGYGDGRWALLDHDISTVVFDGEGKRLLSIPEIQQTLRQSVDRNHAPGRQNGWLVCGLHPDDGSVYRRYTTAEYLAGYAGVPPIVHLRRGERLRRYLQPGLEDGRTFVFWGRDYGAGNIPGPERSRTWVNQPGKMFQSRDGTAHVQGQARYANAVYTYAPDFASNDYREGLVREGAEELVFEFTTPFIIGATPATNGSGDRGWAIYEPGARNGLVLEGKAGCDVSVSVDRGGTWSTPQPLQDRLDLTDHVKGHRQYWLRFGAGARALVKSGLVIRTVCQVNSSVLPQLTDGETDVEFLASNRAVVSAGPNLPQAQAHVVSGRFGTPQVTLGLGSPRGEPVRAIHAAVHVASSNPPRPEVKYQIEYSLDDGVSWRPLVRDWNVPRRGEEPDDFWSQSFCYGSVELPGETASAVQVRFHNDGGKPCLRAEVHLVYETRTQDGARVTFDWTNRSGPQRASHLFEGPAGKWTIPTGEGVVTRWVEMEPAW